MFKDDNEAIKDSVTVSKKKRNIIIIGVVCFIGLLSFFYYSVNNKVKSYSTKFYPGVTINTIDVGGKTKEEAREALKVRVLDKVKEKTIKIIANGKEVVVEYDKINPEYRVDEALNKALKIGKSDNIFKKYSYIKNGIKQEVKVEFGYDKKVIDNYLNTLNSQVLVPAKDATLDIVGDKINVVSAEKGLELDVKKSKDILDENIDSDLNIMNDTIELPVREQLPKITDEVVSSIDGKFGSSTTTFNSGNVSRTENLKLATKFINGTILMPGEVFSYNDKVGERTAERGFKPGAAYAGNQVVQTIGGGICQISTTLYQAIMRSGIPSVERTNHSMKVGYANPSEDSTVAWGYLDYKFKNIYKSPIYIEGIIEGNQVTFNIYGDKDEVGNKTFDLIGVTTGSYNGATSSSGYLVTYEDGKEVSRELISNDTYR